ncbi:MAG: NAD(+)/NADH kinase [Acidimicrobiia bacterium]|nr:NAD(+)/NADH kinase [Acidimicrobiia bacterium]
MTAPVVGLVVHVDRPVALDLARRAATWLRERGVEVRMPVDEAVAVGLPEVACAPEEFPDGLDVAISLGGDGTMLRAVDLVYEGGAAVFGVNVGHLGYLTEVESGDLDLVLERLLAGEYEVLERMMIEVVVTSQGPAGGRWWALNEAVLEKVRGRMVRLAVSINGTFFTTYAADGVIVATPTGSTAYSFSARGPIVSPRHRCLVLTPVSPHMLFDRALVLDAEEELGFEVVEDDAVALALDGRDLGTLAAGDVVTCTGSARPARVVAFGPRDFHQILKAKFGLADR